MKYKDSYLPVDPDFRDHLKKMISENRHGKVHYFDTDNNVEDASGSLEKISRTSEGEFLIMGNECVRLDKIITLLGRPGPSYDAYDWYANACLSCEDPDQF